MRYIDYFIKCIIRRIVRMIFKPKIFIAILFILLILTLSLYSNSYAAENDIFTVYNSINQDLINRLEQGNTGKGFYNYLNNVDYNFLVYYGSPVGSDMYKSSYDTSDINVAFYPSNSSLNNTETTQSAWGGATQAIAKLATNVSKVVVFVFHKNGDYFETGVSDLYIPPSLFNYRSPVISEWLRDKKNVQEITNSITEGTDKIDNTINSTDYDENVVNIDTSSASNIDDSSSTQLFTTIFNNFSNLLSNSSWETVETIDIPVPHTDKNLQITSDILSKIVGTSFIATLINVAWYSVFGLYAFKFANNIFHAIKSGDILNGLNLNDEVISSSMM